jgi:hypothetical protein
MPVRNIVAAGEGPPQPCDAKTQAWQPYNIIEATHRTAVLVRVTTAIDVSRHALVGLKAVRVWLADGRSRKLIGGNRIGSA